MLKVWLIVSVLLSVTMADLYAMQTRMMLLEEFALLLLRKVQTVEQFTGYSWHQADCGSYVGEWYPLPQVQTVDESWCPQMQTVEKVIIGSEQKFDFPEMADNWSSVPQVQKVEKVRVVVKRFRWCHGRAFKKWFSPKVEIGVQACVGDDCDKIGIGVQTCFDESEEDEDEGDASSSESDDDVDDESVVEVPDVKTVEKDGAKKNVEKVDSSVLRDAVEGPTIAELHETFGLTPIPVERFDFDAEMAKISHIMSTLPKVPTSS